EAEGFREPVHVASEGTEHDTWDDDVMEMGDQEHAVVHLPIHGRHSQQHTRQSPQYEGHHETNGPEDRRRESYAPAIHREQPTEDFDPGGHADNHACDTEDGVDAGARPHGEEVMEPHHH